MKPFLEQIADKYYQAYGSKLSDFIFVFPNRRAGLFFRKALATVSKTPLFAPNILAINDLFFKESELLQADKITLLFTLYHSYQKVIDHKESFDQFIFLGDMLLSDFNNIDKYMVNAQQVFQNMSDLKVIDSDLSWMTEEQKKIILQFWGYFLKETNKNLETQFVEMWQQLFALYRTFKDDLRAQKLGYDGMIFREVAEQDKPLKTNSEKVIFIGFNALTRTEEILLKKFQKLGIGDYYFDYQSPEIRTSGNIANQFIAENLEKFSSDFELDEPDTEATKSRQIELISVPSDIGQTKQVYTIINKLQTENQENSGLKTAIVLPDEKLLIPMLYAVPDDIETVNITMGYPLSLTPIAALMDHLVGLQKNCRHIDGKLMFYYKHVLAILNHPYISDYAPKDVEKISEQIRKNNQFFVETDALQQNQLFAKLFMPIQETEEYITYFSEITAQLSAISNLNATQLDAEYILSYQSAINRLADNLKQNPVNLSTDTFFKLLKQITQGINIAFKGEPIEGLQIMGTLETRALDFDNVIITSFNETIFPRKNTSPSLIPYNLCRAFGLPTYDYHDAIFAYNFYRLIYRAKRVYLIYDSRNDGQHGELSRYAAQLEYLYNIPLVRKTVSYQVAFAKNKTIHIEKDERIQGILSQFLVENSKKSISASDINNFIDCPLRFYFSKIEGLDANNEVNENVEANTFGSIYHKVMELIYKPYENSLITAEQIDEFKKNELAIDTHIRQAFDEIFYKNKKGMPLLGQNILIARIIKTYVLQTLQFDKNTRAPFTYLCSELKLAFPMLLSNGLTVNVKGVIDRIDGYKNQINIIDYKTGSVPMVYKDINQLFDVNQENRPKAILQTFFYALLYRHKNQTSVPIQPLIYSLRNLTNFEIVHKVDKNSEIITDYTSVELDFQTAIDTCLVNLFDNTQPFSQCQEVKLCTYCHFKQICNR